MSTVSQTVPPAPSQDRHDLPTDEEHLFLSLVYHASTELENSRFEFSSHTPAQIPPRLDDLFKSYPQFALVPRAPFYGHCLDEGAPQSVTGVPQWIAFIRRYHLPARFYEIRPLDTYITFGGQGSNKVRVRTLGRITVRVPLPGF